MLTPKVFVDGLIVGESARWHEGRLWLAHWGTHEVVAVDMDGNREVMAEVPVNIAFSIDWLPDGRLLVTAGQRLLRQEPDGSIVDHADMAIAVGHEWGANALEQKMAPQPGVEIRVGKHEGAD